MFRVAKKKPAQAGFLFFYPYPKESRLGITFYANYFLGLSSWRGVS
jgi:hypothetical protein